MGGAIGPASTCGGGGGRRPLDARLLLLLQVGRAALGVPLGVTTPSASSSTINAGPSSILRRAEKSSLRPQALELWRTVLAPHGLRQVEFAKLLNGVPFAVKGATTAGGGPPNGPGAVAAPADQPMRVGGAAAGHTW